MSNLQFRALSLAEAEPAAALIRAAFAEQGVQTTPPSSALRETTEIVAGKLAAGGGMGAYARGELVALVLWAPEPDGLYLGRLAVAPDWRGQGLAARLVALGEEEALRRGLPKARVHARVQLPLNIALFQRLGYVEVERRAHPGLDKPTISVMEKALARGSAREGKT